MYPGCWASPTSVPSPPIYSVIGCGFSRRVLQARYRGYSAWPILIVSGPLPLEGEGPRHNEDGGGWPDTMRMSSRGEQAQSAVNAVSGQTSIPAVKTGASHHNETRKRTDTIRFEYPLAVFPPRWWSGLRTVWEDPCLEKWIRIDPGRSWEIRCGSWTRSTARSGTLISTRISRCQEDTSGRLPTRMALPWIPAEMTLPDWLILWLSWIRAASPWIPTVTPWLMSVMWLCNVGCHWQRHCHQRQTSTQCQILTRSHCQMSLWQESQRQPSGHQMSQRQTSTQSQRQMSLCHASQRQPSQRQPSQRQPSQRQTPARRQRQTSPRHTSQCQMSKRQTSSRHTAHRRRRKSENSP